MTLVTPKRGGLTGLDKNILRLDRVKCLSLVYNSITYETLLIHYPFLSNLFNGELELGVGSIDKLFISVKKYNEWFLYSECETNEDAPTFKRGPFNRMRRFYYKGIGFTVGRNCFCKDGLKFHIEVNPSHFSSYTEFKIFCKKLFWKLSNGKVTRIDPSVVFKAETYPVDLFRHTVYFEGKSLSSSYPDNEFNHKAGVFTTYTLGGNSERLSSYLYQNEQEKYLTNFELQINRLKKKNFIVQTVKDLKKLLKVNPFESVVFKNVYVPSPYAVLNDSNKAKIEEARHSAFTEGYHNTRAIRGKNFDRDYGKFFQDLMVSKSPVLMTDVLWKSFCKGLKEWFDA